MIEDLNKHIIQKKKEKRKWYAGEQLEALKFYSDNQVIVLVDASEGSYQGTYGAILYCEDKLFLWRDSFGSCSGCDSLDGRGINEGYEYIKDTLTGVKEFNNPEELIKYLNSNKRDYLYNNELAKKVLGKFIQYLNKIGANLNNPQENMDVIKKSLVINTLKK